MAVRALVISLLLACVAIPASSADRAEIQRKVGELNAHTQQLFGVSLNALRYLIDAQSNNYFPLWHLEKTGDINYIRELESKGYISTETRNGLPDGAEPNQRFLRIIPKGDGLELKRCIESLRAA